MDWQWKVGFLSGYGDAVWQELAGKIRRISKLVPLPNGSTAIMKAFPCVAGREPDPQFDSERMVMGSVEATDELVTDMDRTWSGGRILPVNGRLPKP